MFELEIKVKHTNYRDYQSEEKERKRTGEFKMAWL